jgi:Glycine zipper 2TM domain
MRTPFILALIASVVLPAVPALAQSTHGSLRVDVQTSMQDGYRHDGMRGQSRAELQMAYNQDVAEANRDYRRDLRNARSPRARRDARNQYDNAMAEARRDYDRGLRDASFNRGERDGRDGRMARDWRQYRNYDYDRPEPGQTAYYADQYYRDDNSYQERSLARDERVYRGQDGRYYCRRSDGTTGLIVGAAAGGLFGNAISNGRSSTLGTLLGAAVGATVGASIDRNNVRCR